ncbi:MAG: hypothetical protein J6Z11_07165, partial [Candidatus Riflebacteria bacterium]|nr:hypothetical protein [Candidatus Riflebacteria bacterium]
MKVLRVWISLFVISIFIILAGCGGGKIDYIDDGLNQAPFSKDDIISVKTKTSTVDANGKFQEIVFNHSDSDPSIISCDEGTFQEGVVITVKEIKTTNLGLNPIGSQKYKYLHVITATLGNQAIDEVLILNKPIKLILPTRHLGTDGICYVGVRNSDNDLWTYSRLSDSEIVSLNIHSSRLVEKLPTHYTFYLYKANIQLALFSINQISERDNITADSLTASFTPVIAYKNGTFLNDLNVELTLKGFNLDKLRPSDLETLITYKSRKKNPDTLKANNIACIFKNYGKNNKAVDGNNSLFSHSISISNFDSNFMSGEAKISFTLNLKGVKTQEFSNEFFIELSSISKINNLIPFTYTCCLSFNLKEKSNESSDPNTNTSTNTNSSTD